ncbi:hypothetical protein C8R45DRAFT_435201 [Mycena sanguinolenta]|nr:hypothetical protein C8R45DRAFT_435201 [Mycena sanguinolenta]
MQTQMERLILESCRLGEVFHSLLVFGHHRSFNMGQSFKDVYRYLRDEFSRIHRELCTMKSIPLPWPSPPDVQDKLVRKSSGHFIYAATIIKFIDKDYRPTQRLIVVQGACRLLERSYYLYQCGKNV